MMFIQSTGDILPEQIGLLLSISDEDVGSNPETIHRFLD